MYFLSKRNPNYGSLTLSLDQNNPEVTIDRNPIPYNNPGIYDCQPGQCIYGRSTTTVEFTSELYFFCGANALVNVTPSKCTIIDSTNIIDQIFQHGAFGVGNDVSDVLNVSYNNHLGHFSAPKDVPHFCPIFHQSSKSVYDASYDFDASMYGGVFFTHDENSVTSFGPTYDETVTTSCAENTGNYTTSDQCNQFSGIGYIIKWVWHSCSQIDTPLNTEQQLISFVTCPPIQLQFHIPPQLFTLPSHCWRSSDSPISKWQWLQNFCICLAFAYHQSWGAVHFVSDFFTVYHQLCFNLKEHYTLTQTVISRASNSFAAWFLLVLSFPFIAGSFAIFIVTERESKAKHLQVCFSWVLVKQEIFQYCFS